MNCVENGLDCVANCAALWLNRNPTAAFPAQSVSVNTADYNTFEVCFLIEDDDAWQNVIIHLTKTRAFAVNGEYHSFVKVGNYERFFTIRPGEIAFSDCKYGIKYNDKLIPYSVHAFV